MKHKFDFFLSDICQIRLDFDTVVLDQPSSTGTCSDEFSVDSPASADPPTLCGTFSGTHSKKSSLE